MANGSNVTMPKKYYIILLFLFLFLYFLQVTTIAWGANKQESNLAISNALSEKEAESNENGKRCINRNTWYYRVYQALYHK